MKKLKQKTSINPTFFTLFLLIKQIICLDPNFNLCLPKDCGDGLSISYPFIIRNVHDPICGHPSFEVRCNNGSAVFNMSQNEYKVMDIEYNKKKFRVQNTAVPTKNCQKLENLDIRNFTIGSQFSIVNHTNQNLVLMSNCSGNSLDPGMDIYRVGSIGSCEKNTTEYAMLKADTNMKNMTRRCGVVVETPVEVSGGEGWRVDGTNYGEVMERGFEMTWRAQDCGECAKSGGRCGYNATAREPICFCSDRPHRLSCNPRRNIAWVILLKALGVGAATIVLVIILYLKRKPGWRKKAKNDVNVEIFLKNQKFLAPKRYSYSQVKKMTNSFKVKLGQGGFGSVYRGDLNNGNLVAVKVLNELKGDGKDFVNEVASVGRTSHVNIVSLVGFCLEGHRRALIYEFMPNGSLDKFIYSQNSSSNSHLGWEKLHQIAIGIARGLEYLHRGCNTRILHFDIKPHNILLDQNLCPKISDFGLAKLFPDERSKISMSHMRGTPGYIAPEMFSRNFGEVSNKSDVYSYGMMILEMFNGRKNNEVEADQTSEMYFPHAIYKRIELNEEQLGLHGIVSDEENNMVRKTIIVGLWCIQTNPLNRPTITRVLEMLEGDLELLEIPPKPYLSSPSRPVSLRSPSTSFPSTD